MTAPLRILHVSTRLILGGSQENTVLSCEGQARLGHEVHLAFGPIYGPEGSLLQRVEQFNERCARGLELTAPACAVEPVRPAGAPVTPITLHTVPHLVRDLRPIADTLGYLQLRRLIRRIRPDIVHTHSSKAGILGRLAAWHERTDPTIPAVIHTIHGPPFMPVEGGALRRLARRTTNGIYTVSERIAARRCHAIVSVAQAMTDQFRARDIGTSSLFTTVWSGMDVDDFLTPRPGQSRHEIRAALGLSDSDFVIGTVARLAEHKGHDDLLDALASELSRRPAWKLLWVGDGWLRAHLEKRIDELGLTGRVILTGLVEPSRVPGLIRAMDVLAHPSYREGLPRTVPQALLAGVAPVAYDVDGTREVCMPPVMRAPSDPPDPGTGLLVDVGDRPGLREAIVWLFEHPRERLAMAAHGRELCAARFSAGAMTAALEAVYLRARARPDTPSI